MLELTNSAIKADNESVHEVLSQKAKEVKPTNKTAKNTGAEELQTQSPRSSPPSLHHSLLRLLFTTLFSGFSSPFSCRQCQLREIELSHVSPPSLLISLPPCHLYIVLAWRFISITSHLSSSHRSNCLSPGKPFLL
ncbi:hypothetical protein YC2023_109338 [Brassica napus]